jgi:hypothetical protein
MGIESEGETVPIKYVTSIIIALPAGMNAICAALEGHPKLLFLSIGMYKTTSVLEVCCGA